MFGAYLVPLVVGVVQPIIVNVGKAIIMITIG